MPKKKGENAGARHAGEKGSDWDKDGEGARDAGAKGSDWNAGKQAEEKEETEEK